MIRKIQCRVQHGMRLERSGSGMTAGANQNLFLLRISSDNSRI